MGNHKTKVEVIVDSLYYKFKKGDKGYIDGDTRGANHIPYAVVVCEEKIEFVPIYSLKVID